ncbi:Glucosamine-phosphate N-acetyltransferase-like protein [Xylographa opegraphella]|nr:Glucosamine-phosphate N-acetyltransferase-like protein [Xylographa opegraphella]
MDPPTGPPLFPAHLISPSVLAALPAGYSMRPLRKSDYAAGMLDVLRVLTSVGEVSRTRWEARFEYMRACGEMAGRLLEGGGGGGGGGLEGAGGDTQGGGGRGKGAEGDTQGGEQYGTYFVLVVCEEGGRVVGTGGLVVERKFIHNLGMVGHIEDIAVAKDQQGKRLGLRIIEALDWLAERVGCYKTILDCSEANEGFYVKCGYKRAGLEMAHYYG